MPYELGGRADKRGNRYETRVAMYHLLKVLEEKIEYIILEGLGEDEQGVDIWIQYNDEIKEAQQCKGRNGSKDYWDFGTVNAKGIFNNWKFQLERNPLNTVSLVSPLAFATLEDLTDRSRNTSDNPDDFYNNQILSSSAEFQKFFYNFCKSFGLDPNLKEDLMRIISYLKRIYYRQFPDTELREIILSKISLLFLGDVKAVYDKFVSLVIDEDILGKKLTSTFLNQFIRENNLGLKNLARDNRIIPRFHELNQEYREIFLPLKEGLFKRKEFSICRESLEKGNSLLIHGKAGCGKSGCTEDIINYCEENKIQYVAIKLDKRIPSKNAESWGNELGLPASIAHCIHSIAKDDKAVIILDQLDALRWTQAHSRDSLIVCSEITNQVATLNNERKQNISIIFVCRTYDLENDNNIRRMFNNKKDQNNIQWDKVKIEELNDIHVQEIIGDEFARLSGKIKTLLKTPSNLYIWQRLKSNGDKHECGTTSNLISKWWTQLVKEYGNQGYPEKSILTLKENIVENLDRIGKLYMLKNLLNESETAIDFLHSNGFLIIQGNRVSFAHQSILDYFLSEKMIQQYYNGVDIIDIIGNKEEQTPGRRYQLQMFMQSIIEYDEQDFITIGLRLLNSDSIRYYNKYVFFEILNQIDDIDNSIEQFIVKYADDEKWSSYLINSVIHGKPNYYKILRDYGLIEQWLNGMSKKEVALNLLISVRPYYEIKDVELIEQYAFNSKEDAMKLSHCFMYDVNEDSEEMFQLRMRLYDRFPELADWYIDIRSLLKNCEMRAIRYFEFLLKHNIKNKEQNIYRYEIEFLNEDSEVMIKNGENIIEILLTYIPKDIDNTHTFSDWSAKYHKRTIERACINILKKANRSTILKDPDLFISYYGEFMGKGNDIFNELILDGLYKFPITMSDFVIEYMYNDFERDIIDRTSENYDKLYLAKLALKRHTEYCSIQNLRKLEEKIINYIPSDVIDRYRRRIEFNKGNNGSIAYWSFWGDFQYELLNILPVAKLSKKTLDLIKVLERKFANGTTRYNYYTGHSGSVASPVSGKDLSLNTWLGIINNEKIKNKDRRKWQEVPGGFLESSITEFARSFSNAVSKQPEEFIKLILNTSVEIDETYIDSLFSGVSYSDLLKSISPDLIERMILQYSCDMTSNRANSICDIIEKSDYVEWSQEILDILKEIAINHINPEGDKPNVTSTIDDKMESYDMLFTNAINCVRGSAAQAIGHILWSKKDYFQQFKETIEELSNDINPAVRLASCFALWPSYNIDKEWTSKKILALYEQDHKLAGFHGTKNMLFFLYPKYRERILEIIKKCYLSDDEELIKMGAHCLAEMYILKDEFIDEMLNVDEMSKMQAEEVLFMVMLYFNKYEYNKVVKDIICRFKSTKLDLEIPISRLFYDNQIDLKRDKDFLIDVMNSYIGRRTLHAFVRYLEEQSMSIIDFKDIIISISTHMIDTFEDGENIEYGIDDTISKLVIGLYDETAGSTQVEMKDIANASLDLWDKMFEYQIGSVRRLSQEMMER